MGRIFRAIFIHVFFFYPSSIKTIKEGKYLVFKSIEIFLHKCKFCFVSSVSLHFSVNLFNSEIKLYLILFLMDFS